MNLRHGERTKIIVQALKGGEKSLAQIGPMIDRSKSDASAFLHNLRRKGIVKMVKAGQRGRYSDVSSVWALTEKGWAE